MIGFEIPDCLPAVLRTILWLRIHKEFVTDVTPYLQDNDHSNDRSATVLADTTTIE